MARSRLLSREPQAPHQAAHGVDVIAGAVALLDQLANVLQGESGEPVLLDVGACEHRVCDLPLLLRGEAARPRAWSSVPVGACGAAPPPTRCAIQNDPNADPSTITTRSARRAPIMPTITMSR